MDKPGVKPQRESRAIQLPSGYCACPKCMGNTVFINDNPAPAGMGRILVCMKCQHVWRPSPEQAEQIIDRFSGEGEDTNFYIKRYRPEKLPLKDANVQGSQAMYTVMAIIGLILLAAFIAYFRS